MIGFVLQGHTFLPFYFIFLKGKNIYKGVSFLFNSFFILKFFFFVLFKYLRGLKTYSWIILHFHNF